MLKSNAKTAFAAKPRRLRVAICGTRGVPACYGGFETLAEELGVRLVERGFEVVVYGRSHLIKPKLGESSEYRGMKVRLLPALRSKYLETLTFSFLSMCHLVRYPVDVILLCNAANSPFIWIPRAFAGTPVAVNVDGVERKRSKWNALGSAWYRLGEYCSVWFANQIVADAEIIKRYYQYRYKRESLMVRYGYREMAQQVLQAKLAGTSLEFLLQSAKAQQLFGELRVRPGNYLLYVSRLEPENNALRVVQAYSALPQRYRQRMPLLIVGDAPYAKEYIRSVKACASAEVHFAGYRFGQDYELLQQGAYAYIQASEVGGTHPALVEAIGFANCVIANAVPEHEEVLRQAGLYYPKNDTGHLSALMADVLDKPEMVMEYRRLAWSRAQSEFSWESIADAYERLFLALCGIKAEERAQPARAEPLAS